MKRFLILIFTICFFVGCNTSENTVAIVSNNPVSTPTPAINTGYEEETSASFKISQINPITQERFLEFKGNAQTKYKSFEIDNSEKGLSVLRNGKRLIFIPNANDSEPKMSGNFGLKALLGNDEKQLIYETFTGGNHCCIYQTIIDLSTSNPRTVFRSQDFGIFGVNDKDSLEIFDYENDGILEITQKDTFYIENGCAMVSNPVIYVGFKYDKNRKHYFPLKDFTISQKKWTEEIKKSVEEINNSIPFNQIPKENSSCYYYSSLLSVALSYIYIGKEKEGFDYLMNNYLAFDYENGSIVYKENESKGQAAEFKKDIKKHLSKSKFYKILYKR